MSDNERNNDLSCLVLLTGKVLFCLIVSALSATTERPELTTNGMGGTNHQLYRILRRSEMADSATGSPGGIIDKNDHPATKTVCSPVMGSGGGSAGKG